jgi:hypothetical protein
VGNTGSDWGGSVADDRRRACAERDAARAEVENMRARIDRWYVALCAANRCFEALARDECLDGGDCHEWDLVRAALAEQP